MPDYSPNAPVVELVDAADSKSAVRKDVGVRVSPGAPHYIFMAQKQKKSPKSKPDIDYAGYLQLSGLLSLQHPLSGDKKGKTFAHDEMLFITVHQTYELWFQQILFELDRVQACFARRKVADKDLRVISSSLSRIVEILKLMVRQLDVLETMTPLDFLDFRHVFRTASGFQSMQFRQLEIRLGLKYEDRVTYDSKAYDSFLNPKDRKALQGLEKQKSLLQLLDKWLSRTPFIEYRGYRFWDEYRKAVLKMINGDKKLVQADDTLSDAMKEAELKKLDNTLAQFNFILNGPEQGDQAQWRLNWKSLQAALFINLYRDQPALQLPYKILSDLMDIDETMTLWRYRHALMAQRMLGTKMGSGGSSGHDYLAKSAARHRIFYDLFALSTFLIPRSALPKLPKDIEADTGFRYGDHA